MTLPALLLALLAPLPDSTATLGPEPSVCVRGATSEGPNGTDNARCALVALRVADELAPALDGHLDDEVWSDAQAATGFRQQEPTPGDPASQRTEARVVYTSDAVYVGMRLFDDEPERVRAQFVRRDDNEALSDWAAVMFDSYADRRTAFEFATTPTGTRVDVLHRDDTETDVAWDAVWDVAARRDAEGWTAEFRIPLSQLRFSGGKELKWGLNFGRKIARLSETSFWAPIPPTAGKNVSLFGDLVGLEDLSAPGGVELLPYTVGRLNRAPGDEQNPFYQRNDTWGTGGVDLKYGLTSNLTLTATVNPDFGQVEADPSEVNLTAFETFYAEKRPFFTEGTEIFNFRIVPEGYAFYSRRIGRAPQVSASVPSGGYADAPDNARILGAAKLSGKTAAGWSIGLLSAVTGQVEADVSSPEGLSTQPVEPLTSYTVGRLMRDFRSGQSGIGIMGTAMNRRINDERFDRLRSASYLGGMDWFHRFGARNGYEFSGWFLGTHARGSANAMARTQRSHFFIRPDADHLTYDLDITSMSGWGTELSVRKRSGNFTGSLSGGGRSPGLELNDLGFISYLDTWYVSLQARYSDFTAGEIFRRWYANGQLVKAQSWGLESLRTSGHLNLSGTFLNFWRATLNTTRYQARTWPWTLRGGPALRLPGYTSLRWTLRLDSRKPWTMNLRGTVRFDDQDGSRLLVFDPLVDFRPTSRLTVSLGPNVRYNRDADQYVTRVAGADETTYVVGRIEQWTTAMEARLSYGFSPTLNLDVYAQPFLSNGSYSDFRKVGDPRAESLAVRLPLIPPATIGLNPEANTYGTANFGFKNPDFNVREFRMNAVLRWEYLPGSTLFLVWTQAREDYALLGGLDMGRDLDQLFLAPATNVFMIKLNYWLGL